MIMEEPLQKDAGRAGEAAPPLRAGGSPGVLWWAGWTLLTTAAIPAGIIAAAPLAVLFAGLINLGGRTGLWPAVPLSTLQLPGFVTALALALASAQWFLLRKLLPRARGWFLATAAGVLLGGLAAGLALWRISLQNWDPFWVFAALMLPVGLALGLAQWLSLRRFLPNAYWIILIDILAAGSVLLAGRTFTSLFELMVVFLPGAITGLGLGLLLRQSRPKVLGQVRIEASRAKSKRRPRLAWVGLGAAALVPLFFACIWIYAAAQLAMAKNAGVYPSVEEAITGTHSQGWGGAQVVRIENVHAEPNSRDQSQPHVWFGGATVYMDRVPQGGHSDSYPTGSFYLHVRDGWVHVPEGAFPEFIGWVMELYNMEDVRRGTW